MKKTTDEDWKKILVIYFPFFSQSNSVSSSVRKKAKKEKMADYKGGGLTTVHIREASKLVESVRAEVEQLKKSVLEVFFSRSFRWKLNFQGNGNRQHKLAGLCDGWGLCDTCRWGRRRSQIENSRSGYAQRTQGRVWKFSKLARNKGFRALNQIF